MNWKSLTKAQRDMLILKGLLAVGLLVGLYYLVASPLIERALDVRRRLEQWEARLNDAERMLQGEERLRRQLEENRSETLDRLRRQTPPEINPLLWATEVIYRHTRATGVMVESLAELRGEVPFWVNPPAPRPRTEEEEGAAVSGAPPPPQRRLTPYAVQFNLICSYDRLKLFAYSLEKENPAITLTTVSVVARDASPEQHSVRMVVEWPRVLDSMQAKVKALQEAR